MKCFFVTQCLLGRDTLGVAPPSSSGKMKVYRDVLLKNVMILVLTVTARGPYPRDTSDLYVM